MSQVLKKILELYPVNEFTTAVGFNDAVIGVDLDSGRLIYSVNKCIDILVYADNMEIDEAIDHFEENIRGAYEHYETGPIWANTDF